MIFNIIVAVNAIVNLIMIGGLVYLLFAFTKNDEIQIGERTQLLRELLLKINMIRNNTESLSKEVGINQHGLQIIDRKIDDLKYVCSKR